MKYRPVFLLAGVIGILSATAIAYAQEGSERAAVLDSSDLNRQIREREEKINRLPRAEKEILQEAQKKAAEDPDVKAAVEKRDRALRDLQTAVRNSMLKSDPAIEQILGKLGKQNNP